MARRQYILQTPDLRSTTTIRQSLIALETAHRCKVHRVHTFCPIPSTRVHPRARTARVHRGWPSGLAPQPPLRQHWRWRLLLSLILLIGQRKRAIGKLQVRASRIHQQAHHNPPRNTGDSPIYYESFRAPRATHDGTASRRRPRSRPRRPAASGRRPGSARRRRSSRSRPLI